MSGLSLAVAVAVMRAAGDYTSSDFDTLGITPEDYKLVTGPKPWTKENRRKVTITIEALIFGTIDQLGLGRFQVPSEYVAAILATYVHPANRLVACIWLAEANRTGARAAELASMGVNAQPVDQTSPQALFALVCQLSETGHDTEARQVFEGRLEKRLQKALAQ